MKIPVLNFVFREGLKEGEKNIRKHKDIQRQEHFENENLDLQNIDVNPIAKKEEGQEALKTYFSLERRLLSKDVDKVTVHSI